MTSIMENINFDEFENICRFCLFNCDIKFTQDNVISDVLYKLTNIHFETNDELPQQICLKCFDKINVIYQFSVQCKRTHSCLTECLNKYKNSRLYQEKDIAGNMNILIKLEGDIIIDEHKIEYVDDENLNSTNDYLNDELEINRNVLDKTINELNDEMFPEEIDQNINCSDDDLLIPNTSNIEAQNEEESSIRKLNDLNKDSNSLKSRGNIIIDSAEINKKESGNIKKKQYKFKRSECPLKCVRLYKCKKCSMSFITKTQLKRHMRSHSGVHKCDRCSKWFRYSANLKNHMCIHSGERVHKCNRCSKSFRYSVNLKNHKRTHSGECPYVCNLCSASFFNFYKFARHMRTHSGVRPIKCDLCSNLSSQSENLKAYTNAQWGTSF